MIQTGTELRRWRQDREFSQERLAKMIGCARRSIHNWERRDSDSIPYYIALALWALEHGAPASPPERGG